MNNMYEVIKIHNPNGLILWDEFYNKVNKAPIHIFEKTEMYKYCGIKSYKDLSSCELYIQNKLWKWQYSHGSDIFIIRKMGFHTNEKEENE